MAANDFQPFLMHFKLRDFLHARLLDDMVRPAANWFYIPSDWQENGTTPRGPNQTGEEWRANARLAYSLHSAILWSARHPLPVTAVTCVSRVMEKTAVFSILIWEQVLLLAQERGLLDDVTDVCFWRDTGPHYRAYRMLAVCEIRWTTMFKRSMHIRFGLEHHMKEMVDRYFALLDKCLTRVRKRIGF